MSLERLVLPENKDMVKEKQTTKIKKKKKTPNTLIDTCQGGTGFNLKSTQWSKLKQIELKNKVVLDYNPKYKVNIHKDILI